MKNSLKLVGITAMIAVIGFSIAACSNPTGGGGSSSSSSGSGGGGSIDATKLIGKWVNASYTIIFSDLSGGGITTIDLSGSINHVGATIKGDVIETTNSSNSFKVAFEGEKLKISEGKGTYNFGAEQMANLNGLYSKQP